MDILKSSFRPEFLNRIDDIVMFRPLDKHSIYQIIELIIEDIRKRLADRHIKIELTERAKDYILENAYSNVYGARPIQRFIQRFIETELGKKIIGGEVKEEDSVVVDAEN